VPESSVAGGKSLRVAVESLETK